jgi:hypothetical protein
MPFLFVVEDYLFSRTVANVTNRLLLYINVCSMKYLRQFTMLVLGFIAITALIGGAMLIYDPSGSSLGMSYGDLSTTNFESYFLPGLILFVVVGVGSAVVCGLTYKHVRNYAHYIMAYAIILILFILIQVYLLETYETPHTVYILLALLLLTMGNLIRTQRHVQHSPVHKNAVHAHAKKSTHHAHRKRK